MAEVRRPAGLLLLCAACATNPVTGKRELSLVSESQEIELGRQAAEETRQSIGVVRDSALQAYVRGIGLRLARTTERPNLPCSFDVVDDPAVNAFALPGGFTFVTRGILTHMSDEAQLATVVGHEIGHVTARHSVRQMSRAQIAQLGLGIGSLLSEDIARFSGLASSGLGLLFLKYGRDMETQADDLGFRYALGDGYDVRAMRSMFEMLQRVSQTGGSGRLPQWLASHPDPENRIAKTDERLAAVNRDLSKATLNRDAFLRRLEGVVYGEDPRQGYFEGTRFNHPDLQFRIEFPPGWKTQNQAQAVVAASPAQDAILALSLAGRDPPDRALGTFLGQSGIQGGGVSRASIGGFPAASADFQATGSDGKVLAGRITYVSYNGNTYRLLGYTVAASYPTYSGTFQQAIGSFGRLTDPAALNKQPMRVRLVRLSQNLTVSEFHRQDPSVVPVETVALINGVEVNGVLKSGSWAKRVQ